MKVKFYLFLIPCLALSLGNTMADVIEAPAPLATRVDEGPDAELEALKAEINRLSLIKDRLSLEAGVQLEERKQAHESELLEKEELDFKLSMQTTRLNAELAEAKMEIARLTTETELLEKQLAHRAALQKLALDTEIADIKKEEALLKAKNDLLVAQQLAKLSELKLQDAELKSEKIRQDAEIARLELEIRKHEREDQVEALADRARITYLKDPLQGTSLVISDRRIELNNVITYTTADHVSERINFFNNKNAELPIFIIIDYNPGGSVMSGYSILKAMKGSQAPVYVVVKSFAASMAAAITTLADKSFAYPNAIILHHQMSYGIRGNLTQQKEMLDESAEWWKRLAGPIAEKMGLSMDEFIKKMYENNSDGDWVEFADKAVELKWVDHIIDEIRETSLLENPDKKPKPVIRVPIRTTMEDQAGEEVEVERLPRLVPFDFYYLYDPYGHYRL
ncbi:MAG: ATP-dependent Clp protease protease subunit [Verrucomicrobiales bacterium]|jgi:ATP-dependent Clp protease protease subunit